MECSAVESLSGTFVCMNWHDYFGGGGKKSGLGGFRRGRGDRMGSKIPGGRAR
jgi:hypothetical protein